MPSIIVTTNYLCYHHPFTSMASNELRVALPSHGIHPRVSQTFIGPAADAVQPSARSVFIVPLCIVHRVLRLLTGSLLTGRLTRTWMKWDRFRRKRGIPSRLWTHRRGCPRMLRLTKLEIFLIKGCTSPDMCMTWMVQMRISMSQQTRRSSLL